MDERFQRTELMFGKTAFSKLKNSKVAVFGVGGVGGYVVEILARSGISNLTIIDNDTISVTNINRQLIATTSTVGQSKVEVLKQRILDINPEAEVTCINCFYLPENADLIDLSKFDYVVDCIDTVTAKIELAARCEKLNIPIISSMGSRNKLDFSKFKICDIFETKYDKLAKTMRKELKTRKIGHLKVVYSEEDINKLFENEECTEHKVESSAIGASLMGTIIGSEVVKDIAFGKKKQS